jgi:hypothetical protein
VSGVLLMKIKSFAASSDYPPSSYTYIQNNVMSKKDLTLTSVKIQSDLFEEFKVACVRHKFSFQKLADRCIHMYLTDEDFKRQVHNHNNLDL